MIVRGILCFYSFILLVVQIMLPITGLIRICSFMHLYYSVACTQYNLLLSVANSPPDNICCNCISAYWCCIYYQLVLFIVTY